MVFSTEDATALGDLLTLTIEFTVILMPGESQYQQLVVAPLENKRVARDFYSHDAQHVRTLRMFETNWEILRRLVVWESKRESLSLSHSPGYGRYSSTPYRVSLYLPSAHTITVHLWPLASFWGYSRKICVLRMFLIRRNMRDLKCVFYSSDKIKRRKDGVHSPFKLIIGLRGNQLSSQLTHILMDIKTVIDLNTTCHPICVSAVLWVIDKNASPPLLLD